MSLDAAPCDGAASAAQSQHAYDCVCFSGSTTELHLAYAIHATAHLPPAPCPPSCRLVSTRP